MTSMLDRREGAEDWRLRQARAAASRTSSSSAASPYSWRWLGAVGAGAGLGFWRWCSERWSTGRATIGAAQEGRQRAKGSKVAVGGGEQGSGEEEIRFFFMPDKRVLHF
ncbi:hypothetical protein PR202_gb16907 [Eleusine coracana subsp. coracana]|uniref:Uncharacterized protein n=1 Tax=Eleusine coracana subsp. coracana TaxID=191504 RepID=A0AAV5F1C1_ELECO|nr:hypothetical protein PR202_gb16907 [Eleusine coracana subsp. coracana]